MNFGRGSTPRSSSSNAGEMTAMTSRTSADCVTAVVGPNPSNFLAIRAEAEAKAIYRMTLAMHAALADEGIVTYTGKVEG